MKTRWETLATRNFIGKESTGTYMQGTIRSKGIKYLAYVTFPSIPLVSPTGIFLFYSCNNTPFQKNWCVETKEKPAKQTGMGLRQPKESAKFELRYESLKR